MCNKLKYVYDEGNEVQELIKNLANNTVKGAQFYFVELHSK